MTNNTQAANWTIVDTEDNGTVDRFYTEDEARQAFAEGGYPIGCAVRYSPDPVVASSGETENE